MNFSALFGTSQPASQPRVTSDPRTTQPRITSVCPDPAHPKTEVNHTKLSQTEANRGKNFFPQAGASHPVRLDPGSLGPAQFDIWVIRASTTSEHVLFINDQLAVRFIEEIDFRPRIEDISQTLSATKIDLIYSMGWPTYEQLRQRREIHQSHNWSGSCYAHVSDATSSVRRHLGPFARFAKTAKADPDRR